jgi:predicted ATPase/serine/threonine protein kinase
VGQKLGRYELIAKIGSGGMAEVFLAQYGSVEGFKRQLVIKRMRPELADRDEAVEMFLDEARLCAKLNHPNIVNVSDLGEADGTYFIAMDFVDGPHLGKLARHLVRKQTPLPPLLCAYVVTRAADGLHYAHTQTDPETGQALGIVHRDVSPHNILISKFGDVKLADFGVAKAVGKESETKSGVVKGKVAYMSPEQIYGDELDGRSDVFALGIVLFEITTARRLYKHKSELVSMQRITQEDAPAPSRFNPAIDAELERIILKALHRDRERRYQTANALKVDLDAWISQQAQGHLKTELADFMAEHAGDMEQMREQVPDTGSVRSRSRASFSAEGPPPAPMAGHGGSDGPTGRSPTPPHRPISQETAIARPSAQTHSSQVATQLAADQSSELDVDVVSQLVDGTRTIPARKSDLHLLDTLIQPGPPETDETKRPPWEEPSSGADPSTSGISLSTKAFGKLKTNLSPHGSRFIGRKEDLKHLHAFFEDGASIVSIVGPAGTGKTRLALRYAEKHLPDLSDRGGGAWLCDLTTAHDIKDICTAMAGVLNVPLTGSSSDEESVEVTGRALAGRGKMLVILDNFEQVVDHGPATLSRWAASAPMVRFVVTSRELLRLDGEVCHELAPLPVPERDDDVEDAEAVKLFVDRARAVKPGYHLSAQDRQAVAAIVQKLDGIPLAIELAAARMSVLKPQKILERLSRRFDLLKGGGRHLSKRQATLRGAVDWSWELLSDVEKDALMQCAVFRGGFSLEAAEEVLDLSGHDGDPWPLDVVQALKDKSLLRAFDVTELEGETRFSMYESVREYAMEKLREANKRDAAQERHARYFLVTAEEWGSGATTHGGAECLARLRLDLSNILAVQERSRGVRYGETGPVPGWARADMPLRVAVALEPAFSARGPFTEQVRLVDQGLAAADAQTDPGLKVRALCIRGRARRRLGQIKESRHDFAEALKTAKNAGSRRAEGPVLRDLGILAADEGRMDDALRNVKDALVVNQATGDRAEEGVTLAYLAFLYDELGQVQTATEHYQRALVVLREVGDQRMEALCLGNFGLYYQDHGDVEEAKRQITKALDLLAEVGDRTFEGPFQGYLGNLCHENGELEDAIKHFKGSVGVMRESGNLRYEGLMLGYLAAAYACLDRIDEAEATLAESDQRNQQVGDPRHIECGKLMHGFLEVALARKARAAGNDDAIASLVGRARRRVEEAEEKGEDGMSTADRSDDARRTLRLLKRELERFEKAAG